MNFKGILIAILFLAYAPAVFSFSQNDSLLQELSQMIGTRGPYVKEKQARMARLQDQVAREDPFLVEQFNIYNRL